MPSETPTENVQAGLDQITAKPLMPDTAGLYQAYLIYAKESTCPTCPRPRHLPASYWQLLTLTDHCSGMIPASTYREDSVSFQVLFFRRHDGQFYFYCSETAQKISVRLADTVDTYDPGSVFSVR